MPNFITVQPRPGQETRFTAKSAQEEPKRIYTTLPRSVQNKSIAQMTEETRTELTELRKQAAIDPKKCSECLAEMIEYTEERKAQDPLVTPALLVENNPFAQQKFRCNIL